MCGKDVCDRILCPMKLAMKYCNEGHDILSASDMRKALTERRVKGTDACVDTISKANKSLEIKDIPNISAYHHFNYKKDGMCMTEGEQFYQINDARQVKNHTQLLFHVLELGCTFSFKSFNEYDLHVVVGDHANTSHGTESVYNKIKRDWGRMFTTLFLTTKDNLISQRKDDDSSGSLVKGTLFAVNAMY